MKNWIKIVCAVLPSLILICLPPPNRAQKAKPVVQIGHSHMVGAIAFSPDGRLIVTGDKYDANLILWETSSGKEIRRFVGHNGGIIAVAYSHSGNFVASLSLDKTIRKWSAATGREILKINLTDFEKDLAVSPNNILAFAADDKNIISGAQNISDRKSNETENIIRRVSFAKSSGVERLTYKMQFWDAQNGNLLKNNPVEPIIISPNGERALVWKRSLSKDEDKFLIWDLIENRALNELEYDVKLKPTDLTPLNFSPDGALLYMVTPIFKQNAPMFRQINFGAKKSGIEKLRQIAVWDFTNGKLLKTFDAGQNEKSVVVSQDGLPENPILLHDCGSGDKYEIDAVCALELNSKRLVKIKIERFLSYVNQVLSVAVSNDGRFAAFGTSDSTTTVINTETLQHVSWLSGKMPYVADVSVEQNGKSIFTTAENNSQVRWDLDSGKATLEKVGSGRGKGVFEKDFDIVSPDGKFRVKKMGSSFGEDNYISLQNVAGAEIHRFDSSEAATFAAFSVENQFLAVGYLTGTIRLWNIETGEVDKIFKGHSSIVYGLTFMPDGRTLISGSMDSTMRLWDVETEREKARLVAGFKGEWAVLTPEGLFDASPEGRELMHYAVGLEVVTLEQMKNVYYVPGLLKKIVNDEPLPRVALFTAKDLFPGVEFAAPQAGQKTLKIKLKNRGGGIGQVQVLINHKEIKDDARPANFNFNLPNAELIVDLKGAPLKYDGTDKIEIVARNIAGSLDNRGTARGSITLGQNKSKEPDAPNFYAIVGGVSNYTGDNLDLRFAAKDAEDFARALEIGATKLLKGDKSKFHLRLLTSNGAASMAKFNSPDVKITDATKANFAAAFEDFKNAQPNDVFIVYLSGHGVSVNLNADGATQNAVNKDAYLYLTQEATTSDKTDLAQANVRDAMSISSDELKIWRSKNNALKQVLILDTCAAGAAAASLTNKKDLPSDHRRALERLKDNTGFFVLMGAAANKVSWEASQYGQGLLTYALLQGMKKEGLREEKFADVGLLFAHAEKVVPQMAKNIGGIQSPQLITPEASGDFPIGIFDADEQNQIILAAPKPLILRPTLFNREQEFDDLELTPLLRAALRESSYAVVRGRSDAKIVFVEADEMSDAVKPSGSYVVAGDQIQIRLRLIHNKKIVADIALEGKLSEKEDLIKKLVAAVNEQVKSL